MKKYKLGEIADFNVKAISKSDSLQEIIYLDTSSITENVISDTIIRHYKIFCVNGNTGFRNESRIFYFIHLQNEEAYERKESSSA